MASFSEYNETIDSSVHVDFVEFKCCILRSQQDPHTGGEERSQPDLGIGVMYFWSALRVGKIQDLFAVCPKSLCIASMYASQS
jgi:hypothetical protein